MTVFDEVENYKINKFLEHGFFYESINYINVFRWMWNELHIHPDIKSFSKDPQNRTKVSFSKLDFINNDNNLEMSFIVNSYDNAIIETVNFLYKNIDNMHKK